MIIVIEMGCVPAGQMAAQGNVGGGSFVCGLKRTLTPRDTLEFQGMIGIQAFCKILQPFCAMTPGVYPIVCSSLMSQAISLTV